jgi:hypothetical protein
MSRRRGREPVTPREIILRANRDGTDRTELVRRLSEFSYSFTEYAPYPFEGSRPGTWNQVLAALANGLLSQDEYDQIESVVQPPTPPPSRPTAGDDE